MASINKLSIRGVRSFSPDDKEQVIEFFFPVTVIVGSNGCGKTTIIESLKYAVTGSLPPGNRSGQAFVHDPKSAGQTVVKANIKLRFTNRAGSSMVVCRAMEVQQKKTTLSFKALDGVLRTTDPETGERISLSHKCTELDRQIPTLMGVSKPVLEHVVFCHQEDSSWPLMEGAVLKKRFDDIFDSTRYAKALEEMRTISKKYNAEVKDLKAELSGLSSHQHAAKQFRLELETHNAQIEELEEEILSCKEELKEVEAEMERARGIRKKVSKAQEELDDKRNTLEREQTKAATQLSMLQDNLTEKHTLQELKDMLSDFDDQMAAEVQRKREMEAQIQSLREKVESYRKQEMQLQGHIGKLEAEREAHEKLLKDRLKEMDRMAQSYTIDLTASQTLQASLTSVHEGNGAPSSGTQSSTVSLSNDDIDAFYQALNQKAKSLENDLNRYRKEARAAEDQQQVVLGDLMGKQKSIENDRGKIRDQRQEARSQIDDLSSKLSHRGPRIRKSEIEEAKRDLKKLSSEREKLNNDPRRNDIPVEIRNHEGKIDKLKREIDDNVQIVRELRQNAEEQQAIVVLREQAEKQLEDLQEAVGIEEARYRQYNLTSPTSLPGLKDGSAWDDSLVSSIHTWSNRVEDKYNETKVEYDSANDSAQKAQKKVSETTALLEHNKTSRQKLERRMESLDNKMSKFQKLRSDIQAYAREDGEDMAVNQNSSPQEVLDALTDQMDVVSAFDKPEIVRKILRKFINRVKTLSTLDGGQRYVCLCCERDMEGSEVDKFMASLSTLYADNSKLLKGKDSKTNEQFEKYQKWKADLTNDMNDLLEYSRVKHDFDASEKEISDLGAELQMSRSTLGEAKGKSEEIEKEMSDLRSLLDLAKSWCDEAGRISTKRLQISDKHETSMSMSMTLPDTGGRDLKTVERDLEDKREEKETLMNKIVRLNKEMSNLNSQMSKLAVQAETKEKTLKERESRYAKEQEATTKRAELTETIEKLGAEDKKLEDQLAPIRQKIREKEMKKQRARSQAQAEEAQLNESLSVFKNDFDALKVLSSKIEEYGDANKEQELERLNEKITKLNLNVQKKETELKSLMPELESLSKSVGDQEQHKKTIEDNIEQFDLKQSIAVLTEEIVKLEKNIQKIDGADTCDRDYGRAGNRKSELTDAKARHEGRRGGIVENIRALKRKLKTPEYKDIDARHRVANIKHSTTVSAVSDLDKYYTALDKALMRFHGVKIAEINKIIRELWTLTYKGEDITNIELVSGQDTGSRAKRSYNYRVVMTKGNTKLDMRGRCSAGQRVLACIVIRLALAETFCVNCGVIALDEPTVNLDYENKRGLAVALGQIIALRAQQSNFQLITITHDEEFVVMMKAELATHSGFDMPDRYFHVRREEAVDGKYYSKINAIDWDELA